MYSKIGYHALFENETNFVITIQILVFNQVVLQTIILGNQMPSHQTECSVYVTITIPASVTFRISNAFCGITELETVYVTSSTATKSGFSLETYQDVSLVQQQDFW